MSAQKSHVSPVVPPPETVAVTSKVVACDGGGAFGHPRVYLNMGDKSEVDCPYCDRRFVFERSPASSQS